MTAHGKYNLRRFTDDGIIIADGAALSYEFVELFERNAQMYLYDCFEALIVKKLSSSKTNKVSSLALNKSLISKYFADFPSLRLNSPITILKIWLLGSSTFLRVTDIL